MSVTHAYAMSRLSTEACTPLLVAGRGHGYRLAAATAAANGRALDGPAVRLAVKPLVKPKTFIPLSIYHIKENKARVVLTNVRTVSIKMQQGN